MVENIVRQTTKKTYYKWSLYINILLFFIIALFTVLLVIDCIDYGKFYNINSDRWLLITRDIGFMAIAYTLIFLQFFKNLFTIMKRSL